MAKTNKNKKQNHSTISTNSTQETKKDTIIKESIDKEDTEEVIEKKRDFKIYFFYTLAFTFALILATGCYIMLMQVRVKELENSLEQQDRYIFQINIDHELALIKTIKDLEKEYNNHIEELKRYHLSEIAKYQEKLKNLNNEIKSSDSIHNTVKKAVGLVDAGATLYDIATDIPSLFYSPFAASYRITKKVYNYASKK